MDEPFVQLLIPCRCGTELQIHGQHFDEGWRGSRFTVNCPKCKFEHELPTKPLPQKQWEERTRIKLTTKA